MFDDIKMNKTCAALSKASLGDLRSLAAEIRAGREALRLSEVELADRVGCSRDDIRGIETARPSVPVGCVFEAATVVGLDLFSGRRSRVAPVDQAPNEHGSASHGTRRGSGSGSG